MAIKNILLVDDHSLIREGIKSTISDASENYMIHEAQSIEEALSIFEKIAIDLAVLDISLPDGSGMDLAEKLYGEYPNLKIIMLSMYDDYEYISKCLEIGVDGYILKNNGDEILKAVEEVSNNGKYYCSGVKDLIVNQYAVRARSKQLTDQNEINLTNREKEVMELVINGATSKDIAEKLFISTRTVDTHRSNIMKKLDVKNSIGLINKVKELGLLNK